jgi:hypothetical protein
LPLQDLKKLATTCSARISTISLDDAVSIDNTLLRKIVLASEKKFGTAQLAPDERSIVITTSTDKVTYITLQEIRRLVELTVYLDALMAYSTALDKISNEAFGANRKVAPAVNVFSLLPATNFGSVSKKDIAEIKKAIGTILPDVKDRARMTKLLSEPSWAGIGSGKKLDRNDWINSPLLSVGGMVANASAKRVEFCEVLLELGVTTSALRISASTHAIPGGENVIYYGAPGTGKSRKIKDLTEDSPHIKTIFHPDMQNSDFVGSLKPVMADENVKYEFSPGPFAKSLALARSNPSEIVYLIIEELNRAPPAAVFGELFLLLDRETNGSSEYSVDFPSDEFKQWLYHETGQYTERISLPSNLSIFATMNSADQGVYPVDTAFRRRWHQEYMPIDFSHKDCPKGSFDIIKEDGTSGEILWIEFARILNLFLSKQLKFSEDRLLGPWWVTDAELLSRLVPGKLLIYLWDDLLRHKGREEIFASNIDSYGELAEKQEVPERIFSTKLLSLLEPKLL